MDQPATAALYGVRQVNRRPAPLPKAYRVRMAREHGDATTLVLMAANASQAMATAAELEPGARLIGCRFLGDW